MPHTPLTGNVLEPIRLSKLMSQLGLCSRREADRFIELGWVRVDGKTVNTLGTKVDPDAQVELDARARQTQDRKVTVLLNKPVGIVSGQAEEGYRPAIDLIRADNQWAPGRPRQHLRPDHLKGLAPAGRLDIESQGLLVLTQDGRVARQLVDTGKNMEKEYLVRYSGRLTPEKLALLCHGLELDGRQLRPARVTELNRDQMRFILQEGRKRQIRRMCELVDLQVMGLKRVRIGRVRLGKLPEGKWRFLAPGEDF